MISYTGDGYFPVHKNKISLEGLPKTEEYKYIHPSSLNRMSQNPIVTNRIECDISAVDCFTFTIQEMTQSQDIWRAEMRLYKTGTLENGVITVEPKSAFFENWLVCGENQVIFTVDEQEYALNYEAVETATATAGCFDMVESKVVQEDIPLSGQMASMNFLVDKESKTVLSAGVVFCFRTKDLRAWKDLAARLTEEITGRPAEKINRK